MRTFIDTAESRETSRELMEAIYAVAGYNDELAERIWEEGPNTEQLFGIVGLLARHNTSPDDFVWGASGTDWTNGLFPVSYDFGHTDLAGVVKRINDGPVQGFDYLTPEYLAAAYAVDAAIEATGEDKPSVDDLFYHLQVLTDNGARFIESEALQFASFR